jgi:hypothetical protein
MMNKHLLATFVTLSTINFFSVTQIQSSYHNATKTQLLKHLKNVNFTLQQHLKTMDDNWQAGSMYSDDEDDDGELAGMTFVLNLSENFYKNSTVLQQKISELVTPTFNFICNNIKPLNINEISHHLCPYTSSPFDKDTTRQLQTLLQSLYTKHYQIYRNSNLPIELTQMPIDELFEQCIWLILGTNDLAIYESRALLQKLDAKIKELEQA